MVTKGEYWSLFWTSPIPHRISGSIIKDQKWADLPQYLIMPIKSQRVNHQCDVCIVAIQFMNKSDEQAYVLLSLPWYSVDNPGIPRHARTRGFTEI